MLAVAFFCDRSMLPGLHAALLSLLRSNSEGDFDIFIYSDGLSEKDKVAIGETFHSRESKITLTILEYSPSPIQGANYLNGNATTYGRLYLGELLPAYRKCIYLDSDIIVNVSLSKLFDLLDDEIIFYADGAGQRNWSVDKKLFIHAGIDIDGPYFNAGVLAINLDRWRSMDGLGICRATAERFPNQFQSADQAVLNVAFHDRFGSFGSKYNNPLPALGDSPDALGECIYHFVASPKPWDLGGRYLHNSFPHWHNVYRETAIGRVPSWRFATFKRNILISKQVFKAFLSRLRRK